MGRRVLVTNATTDLGRCVSRALVERGDQVLGWVRETPVRPLSDVFYIPVDGHDSTEALRAVDHAEPEGVICLPPGGALDEPCLQRDVRETKNLFYSLPAFTPAVFVSMGEVYGSPSELPCREDHITAAVTPIARARREGELAALDLHPDTVVARPFVLIGPGMGRAAPAANLDLVRDICDVRDVVTGILLLLDRGIPGVIYNLCSGAGIALREAWDKPAEQAQGDDAATRYGSPERAEGLGWVRRFTLADSCAAMREG